MLLVNQLTGFGAGGGGQPIRFVGGVIATAAGSGTLAINSGLTGGIDTAAASGDFVVAALAAANTSDLTLSITDGTNPYTLIGTELYANGTRDINLRVAYKFITADTAITFGSTAVRAAYVFRGVDTTTPIDVTTTTATGTANGKPNPPAITPVTPGAFVVSVVATAYANAVPGVYATPSLLGSFIQTYYDGTLDTAMGIGHVNNWTSGPVDEPEIPDSGAGAFVSSSNSWAAITFALRPSA